MKLRRFAVLSCLTLLFVASCVLTFGVFKKDESGGGAVMATASIPDGPGIGARSGTGDWGKVEVINNGAPSVLVLDGVRRNMDTGMLTIRITANDHFSIAVLRRDGIAINEAIGQSQFDITGFHYQNISTDAIFVEVEFTHASYNIQVDSVLREVKNKVTTDECFADKANYNLRVFNQARYDATGNGYRTPATHAGFGDEIIFENIAVSGYRLVYLYIWTPEGKYILGAGNEVRMETGFTMEDLDTYVHNRQIRIVAVYTEQIEVNISISIPTIDTSKIAIRAVSPIVIAGGRNDGGIFVPLSTIDFCSESEIFDGARLLVDKGSEIFINRTEDDGAHRFVNVELNQEVYNRYSFVTSDHTVDGEISLNFVYITDVYEITFTALVDGSRTMNLEQNIVNITTSRGGNTVQLGDTISNITFVGLDAFRFEDIVIRRALVNNGEWEERWEDIKRDRSGLIDTCFVTDFVQTIRENNTERNVIEVVIQLSARFKVSVNMFGPTDLEIPENSFDLFKGTVVGEHINFQQVSLDSYFDAGTILEIRAVQDLALINFSGFGRATLMTDEISNGNNLRFSIVNDNRTIIMHYDARFFGLVSNNDIESFTFLNEEQNFRVGDTIVISFDIPSNHNVTRFTVNGQNFKGEIRGNTVSIPVTAELLSNSNWFSNGNIIVNYSVQTGLKPAIVMAYVLPSVLIPLLIAILLTLFIINARRKAIIRKQLVGERADKVKRNVGGYISDLREGNISGGVSKEDVKRAMKESKGKDKPAKEAKPEKVKEPKPEKAKPEPIKQEPAAAPTPSPISGMPNFSSVNRPTTSFGGSNYGQPVQQPANINLVGTKLTPSRTFETPLGRPVAKLNSDFTISDMNGAKLGSARMSDGKILNNSGAVIGSISGNGMIV